MNINATNARQVSKEPDATTMETGPAKINLIRKTETAQANQKSQDPSATTNAENLEKEEAEQIVDSLNEYSAVLKTQLGFSLNEKNDRVVITVRNKETEEIIREIPSEELQKIQETMEELTGLILNKKV